MTVIPIEKTKDDRTVDRMIGYLDHTIKGLETEYLETAAKLDQARSLRAAFQTIREDEAKRDG